MKSFRDWPTFYSIIAVVSVIAIAVGVAAIFSYTDRSSFCPSCHEMGPYYQAWLKTKHWTVSCHRCHVAPGSVAYFVNKVYDLREVVDHFVGNSKFPMGRGFVPDDRCRGCHPHPKFIAKMRFDHTQHSQTNCSQCHPLTGHPITLADLARAGILAPGAKLPGAATVASNAMGHTPVICFDCHHHRVNAPCSTCHLPPHPDYGPCDRCHKPGTTWTFNHPANTGEHSFLSFPCVRCHPGSVFTRAFCTCHGGRAPSGD